MVFALLHLDGYGRYVHLHQMIYSALCIVRNGGAAANRSTVLSERHSSVLCRLNAVGPAVLVCEWVTNYMQFHAAPCDNWSDLWCRMFCVAA